MPEVNLGCLARPEEAKGIPFKVYVFFAGEMDHLSHQLGQHQATFLDRAGFEGQADKLIFFEEEKPSHHPGKERGVLSAAFGLGKRKPGKRYLYEFGSLATHLPEGFWQLVLPAGVGMQDAVLGFALGAYRFFLGQEEGRPQERLRKERQEGRGLTAPNSSGHFPGNSSGNSPGNFPGHSFSHFLGQSISELSWRGMAKDAPVLVVRDLTEETKNIAQAIWFIRDLVNMPANLLSPEDLARHVQVYLHAQPKAKGWLKEKVIRGEELLTHYPAIAEVGKGSERKPCVLVASWQGSHAVPSSPLIYLVGKGVCFDSGGYDLKPSSGMLRMKKDMGGAALMAGLAGLLIEADLPLRFELRLGCVENSVSGQAMRPLDVINTRKGLTVEIGNTDAEGRLVLCDLLAEASENKAAMIIDAATLTGAARVALGPDIPALFCNNLEMAQALLLESGEQDDPLWPLPLWEDYEEGLKSSIADLNNVSSTGMAGAITAALFLRRFVGSEALWAHIDTYAWNDTTRPGRPQGGEALALRTLYYFMKGHNFNMNNN
ncbi:leucyl aminopeptidase family protein [Entomobacter blattae]|uniref:Cytosol aminopeptidase n=1 Tax=Entomobacter blattae TaxID=2762277 RepID=A0A7H1NRY6_9PROT|nr:leucyl aminopeptidase family protein [Entomobacter blattae]QNT78546.1 cytosol aminopeptidase [Entomobacter blattae]